MLEKRIEVPAQIAKRKFTRQSCMPYIFMEIIFLVCYNENKIANFNSNRRR